jgi:hypothetical protein
MPALLVAGAFVAVILLFVAAGLAIVRLFDRR